jgi:hypothetical protein
MYKALHIASRTTYLFCVFHECGSMEFPMDSIINHKTRSQLAKLISIMLFIIGVAFSSAPNPFLLFQVIELCATLLGTNVNSHYFTYRFHLKSNVRSAPSNLSKFQRGIFYNYIINVGSNKAEVDLVMQIHPNCIPKQV